MVQVVIYSTQVCPYCVQAKALLERKGVTAYQEIDVSGNADLLTEMMEKAGGRRTVPQIFIDGKHIGGFDDLSACDQAGELDGLLT